MYGTANIIKSTNSAFQQLQETTPEIHDILPEESASVSNTIYADNTRKMLIDNLTTQIKLTRMQSEIIKELCDDIENIKRSHVEIINKLDFIKEHIEKSERSKTPQIKTLREAISRETPRFPIRNVPKPPPKK